MGERRAIRRRRRRCQTATAHFASSFRLFRLFRPVGYRQLQRPSTPTAAATARSDLKRSPAATGWIQPDGRRRGRHAHDLHDLRGQGHWTPLRHHHL